MKNNININGQTNAHGAIGLTLSILLIWNKSENNVSQIDSFYYKFFLFHFCVLNFDTNFELTSDFVVYPLVIGVVVSFFRCSFEMNFFFLWKWIMRWILVLYSIIDFTLIHFESSNDDFDIHEKKNNIKKHQIR